jgi:hypothetical protein
MTTTHNLDIQTYSLSEIFSLLEIGEYKKIDPEHMKRAKHKVLMTHPDKSRLPPEYFLFYKKAFDIVLKIFNEQQRQHQTVPSTPIKYCPLKNNNKQTTSQIIDDAKQKEFQSKFNRLFDENMTSKVDLTKNAWFSQEQPSAFDLTTENVSVSNMGTMMEKIKEKQSGLVLYHGVENMMGNRGTNLYDNELEEDDSRYITSDPFSKLKYDDLRKVHKDQTVFSVSERDFQKVPQYSSVDHFMRERGAQSLTPIEKPEAEKMFLIDETRRRQELIQKQHAAELRTLEYEEKNKRILANFLHLGN